MLGILEGLPGVACHQDDVVVFGKNQEEHNTNITAVLQRLKDARMTLNPRKSEFSKRSVKFEVGIAADQEKIEAIRKMPLPKKDATAQVIPGHGRPAGKISPGTGREDETIARATAG